MKTDTENVLRVILKQDGTVPAETIRAAMSLLRGETADGPSDPIRQEILTRSQVATILGVNPVTVDYYGRTQRIRRIYLRGGVQSQGYSRKSVMEFIERASDPQKQDEALQALKVRAQKRRRKSEVAYAR